MMHNAFLKYIYSSVACLLLVSSSPWSAGTGGLTASVVVHGLHLPFLGLRSSSARRQERSSSSPSVWRKKITRAVVVGGFVWWKGSPQGDGFGMTLQRPNVAHAAVVEAKEESTTTSSTTTTTTSKKTIGAGTVVVVAAGAGTLIGTKLRQAIKEDEDDDSVEVEASQRDFAKVLGENDDDEEEGSPNLEQAKERVEKLLKSMPTSTVVDGIGANETREEQAALEEESKPGVSSTATVADAVPVEPTTPSKTAPVFFEEPIEKPADTESESETSGKEEVQLKTEPEPSTVPSPTVTASPDETISTPVIKSKTLSDYTSAKQNPLASLTVDLSMLAKGRYASSTDLPLKSPKYRKARQQPKAPQEEDELKQKYASIDDIEERAYQILVDLGMVEPTDSSK